MTVVRAAEQIAFPMTWDGSVFDVRWTLPDRYGIDDLSHGLNQHALSFAM